MSEAEMTKEFEKFTGSPFVKDFNHLIPIYNKCYQTSLNRVVHLLLNTNSDAFLPRMAMKQAFSVSDITQEIELETLYLHLFDYVRWYNYYKEVDLMGFKYQ